MQHLGACVQRMQNTAFPLPVQGAQPFPVGAQMGGGGPAHPHHPAFPGAEFMQQQPHPSATPFATLPGVSPADIQQLQQQQQQQAMEMMVAAAAAAQQMHGVTAAAGSSAVSPPEGLQHHPGMASYPGNVPVVPMTPPSSSAGSDSRHTMSLSPASAHEAPFLHPEVAFMRAQAQDESRDSLHSQSDVSPRSQLSAASTQLKIEIPSPKPRELLQSTTPILKCASPPPSYRDTGVQDNRKSGFPGNHRARDSRLAQHPAVVMETVWRPW